MASTVKNGIDRLRKGNQHRRKGPFASDLNRIKKETRFLVIITQLLFNGEDDVVI